MRPQIASLAIYKGMVYYTFLTQNFVYFLKITTMKLKIQNFPGKCNTLIWQNWNFVYSSSLYGFLSQHFDYDRYDFQNIYCFKILCFFRKYQQWSQNFHKIGEKLDFSEENPSNFASWLVLWNLSTYSENSTVPEI